ALGLLETTLARHGTISLAEAVAPARDLARDGFEVRPTLARGAVGAAGSIGTDPVLGPLYVPGGVPVDEGAVVRNPALADCLDLVATAGAAGLSRGPLGHALVETVRADGGYLTVADLDVHETVPIELQRCSFASHTVLELPLPTQGPAVLYALAALDGTPALQGEIDWD